MKKTFKQFLSEAPIPDDWDASIYSDRIPFAKRIKYATQKAEKIGTGSSRVAFKLPYQGRNTVLKIAKNKKGMAQNDQEVQMLNDYYARDLNLMIPIIDYDENNELPTWLHVEYARKAKDSDFKNYIGASLNALMEYTADITGKKYYGRASDLKNLNTEHEFVQNFINLTGNYDHPIADYGRLANWGVFNGAPVLIDMGLSNDIYRTHYS